MNEAKARERFEAWALHYYDARHNEHISWENGVPLLLTMNGDRETFVGLLCDWSSFEAALSDPLVKAGMEWCEARIDAIRVSNTVPLDHQAQGEAWMRDRRAEAAYRAERDK